MNYTALDFETATSSPTSICSVGLCRVENGQITDKKEILVRPEPFVFNDYNIKIHGITPESVYNRFTFDYYWDEIKPYLDNTLVIAHNTSFDITVLRKTLDMFGLDYPKFKYLCTVKLSQKAYPELFSHKLNNLCDALGICFNHHHAMDDAYACSCVFQRILEEFNLNTIEDIENKFNINAGLLYPGWQEKKKSKKSSKKNACK